MHTQKHTNMSIRWQMQIAMQINMQINIQMQSFTQEKCYCQIATVRQDIALQTLISNVFWQLTYEQHTVKRCQRGLWRRMIAARPNQPPALVLSCWKLASFLFLIPSVWIWEEYEMSGRVQFKTKYAVCKINVCVFVSVNTNTAAPLCRWWSCTSTPVCFAVSSWGGFASWVSPSCMAPSSSSCTGTVKWSESWKH